MGREVRKVPADWTHPKRCVYPRFTEEYTPLYENRGRYARDAAKFLEKANSEGLQAAVDWFGRAPDESEYMPDWPEAERTHYMMYEDTSEGTPISPAFATPEELARWLADTGASAFGGDTAPYGAWLRIANGGWAPSAVMTGGKLISGVEAALS